MDLPSDDSARLIMSRTVTAKYTLSFSHLQNLLFEVLDLVLVALSWYSENVRPLCFCACYFIFFSIYSLMCHMCQLTFLLFFNALLEFTCIVGMIKQG